MQDGRFYKVVFESRQLGLVLVKQVNDRRHELRSACNTPRLELDRNAGISSCVWGVFGRVSYYKYSGNAYSGDNYRTVIFCACYIAIAQAAGSNQALRRTVRQKPIVELTHSWRPFSCTNSYHATAATSGAAYDAIPRVYGSAARVPRYGGDRWTTPVTSCLAQFLRAFSLFTAYL